MLTRFIPFILALLCIGCTKNEIKLTFKVSEEVDTPCRILYYASDKQKGMIRETVAELRSGEGEIILPERNPSLFYLFTPSQNSPGAIFYAKRGDKITVTGNSDDIYEWSIGGNSISDGISEWRIKNAEILKKHDYTAINKAVKTYIEAHKDSPVSLILLYVYYSRRENESEFFALQSKLDKDIFEDEGLMGALSSADLITGLVDKPVLPEMVVLKDKSGYADTLKLKNGNASILIFKDNNEDNDIPKPDSLGRLADKFDEKMVAEIWMGNDSLTWRRYIDRDTIENVSRLWMPLGVADNNAIALGVRRIPYFIVIDNKGKEIYRGDSASDAITKFESIK